MKARYVSSPSHRTAEQSLAVSIAWTVVGIGVLVILDLTGAFRLEEELPAVNNASAIEQYEVR
jgi:hypothetical protein